VKRFLAIIIALMLLIGFNGCPPGGTEGFKKLNEAIEKIDDIDMQIDDMQMQMDELIDSFNELSEEFDNHLKKYHNAKPLNIRKIKKIY
jgi:uncharacterized coiled-coil DUF342 family protein